MSLKKTLLASAMAFAPLVAMSGTASAQPTSGIYIAGGGGFNWAQDTDISSAGRLTNALQDRNRSTRGEIQFQTGWVALASIGYGFGNGLRAEIEGSYRENEVDSIKGFGGTTGATGRARTYGAMANVFYDIDLGYLGLTNTFFNVQPYVGAGIGWQWRDFKDISANVLGARDLSTDSGDGRFAYQAIVGVAAPLHQFAPGLSLTAEYRFLGTLENDVDTTTRFSENNSVTFGRGTTKSENFNHSVLIGLRYAFNPPVPPAPPAVVAPAAPAAAAPAPARTYLVFFDFDRADLNERARQIIGEAAQNSSRTQTTRIEVAGHADRAGNPQYNQRLSERRAQAVAGELERRGVPRSAMTIQGFGENRPLVQTADGAREPQNRRVEIVLR